MSGKSVLIVINTLQIGGAERHLSLVLPRLRARGFDLSVFCLLEGGPIAEVLKRAGIEIFAPRPYRSSSRISRLVRLPFRIVALHRAIRRVRPDVAHFFLPLSYLVGLPVARLAGVQRLVMSRRSRSHYQRRHPLVGWIERRFHRQLDAAVANSRAVASDLRDEGIPSERQALLYNGVDVACFDAPRDRAAARSGLGIAADAICIAMVANLIPYKGHTDLIDALAGIADRIGAPWRVLLIGRDDGIGDELMNRAERAGIGDAVMPMGVRDDVPEILAMCDIGVLCSHEEGFSNTVLEGMAAGLPMVVTDVGGNAEAVTHGEAGRVVPAHDPGALGAALLDLARDKERARAMGLAARARVARHFALDACVDGYRRLYDGLPVG